eukprot:Pompholyxophrys_punicea_v1_NODE_346_length_2198_cov_4.255131.p2 type:complete len:147 gc:universal NODE_346_length_2198_cov_4.255131:771-331(-)
MIFNMSLTTQTFPSAFKNARLVPIFKSGSPLSPQNYRPLSILPTLSKPLEKLADEQLRSHLECHNFFSSTQFGFRKYLDTLMAIANIHERIIHAFTNRTIGLGIFLTFKKPSTRSIMSCSCSNSRALSLLPHLNGLLHTFKIVLSS